MTQVENEVKSKETEVLTPEQQKLKRKQEIIRVVKFVLFSASAGIIQTVTFTLMNEVGKLPYWPSYLTALILSVVWNFTFNRKFTFKSASNVPKAMLLVLAYYAVFTPLSTLWGDALTVKAGWNEYLVLALTMLINMSTEYLYSTYVVFRKSMNTNDLGKKEKEELAKLAKTEETAENSSEESAETQENQSTED